MDQEKLKALLDKYEADVGAKRKAAGEAEAERKQVRDIANAFLDGTVIPKIGEFVGPMKANGHEVSIIADRARNPDVPRSERQVQLRIVRRGWLPQDAIFTLDWQSTDLVVWCPVDHEFDRIKALASETAKTDVDSVLMRLVEKALTLPA